MSTININHFVFTGNLTADPEKRSENAPVNLRVAVNGRKKDGEKWVDTVDYFRVTVWGARGENCMRYLSKGSGVAIDGRLGWNQYEDKDGVTRESVTLTANTVQFLGGGSDSAGEDE